MKKKLMLLFMLLCIFTSTTIYADDMAIKKALDRLGIQQSDVQPLLIKGLKSVLTDRGVFYLTEDGQYILYGKLYDIRGPVPVNLTNKLLVTKLEALKEQMIVYKALKEKYVISIFTDITCSYCQKLHQQIHEYNKLGITVRYLAFPHQGLGSKLEKDMQSIWCSSDKIKAFNTAMNSKKVSLATCKNDIRKQYMLGIQFGVQGTPAIILSNGLIIPGYHEAKEIIAILETQHFATRVDS